MADKYDIVIIGSGPGGYVAAIRAAQLGDRVALIEKDLIGGTCLNRGCIPTKAILASMEVYEISKRASEFGIEGNNPTINWTKVQERKDKIVTKLRKGVEYLLKKNNVDVIFGEGIVKEPGRIEILNPKPALPAGRSEVLTRNIIIATGSKPYNPFGFGITSDEALNLKEIPKEITIIGGGAIGCEFAQIFNSAGSKVTLIEAMPNLLPNMDEELGKALEQIFKKKGIDVQTNTKFQPDAKPARPAGGRVGSLLVAIGRKYEKIEPMSGVHIVGDISGKQQLAHLASRQGLVTVENIHGIKSSVNYNAVPSCVYTNPEIASVGQTEAELATQKVLVRISKFPIRALAKAQIMGELDGFIKIISDSSTDKILGVHIIGPQATNIISEAAIVIENGLKTESIINTIHSHPTLTEGVIEAAEGIFGKSIHI